MLQAGRSKNAGGYRFGYQGQEADNKIGGLGQHTTAKFWEYDTWAVKRWNTDPVTFPWQSTYATFNNNPIIYSDGLGLFGEYELSKNNTWSKVSTKGDEIGVDFYHTDGTDSKGKKVQTTYITDRKGNWNTMNNGRYNLKGESRGKNINWYDIYREWADGTGPESSVFEGNNAQMQSITENYLFIDSYNKFKKSDKIKDKHSIGFLYILDNVRTRSNMQVQMMGSYNASYYTLGNKTLILIQDSKSRSSFYYHLPVTNYKRDSRWIDASLANPLMYNDNPNALIKTDKETNTYQSYMFLK
jgi:hypothetical protein